MSEVNQEMCESKHKTLSWFIGVVVLVSIAVNGGVWTKINSMEQNQKDRMEKMEDRQVQTLVDLQSVKSDVKHLKDDFKDFTKQNGKH